jgi:hypothetical protein
MEPCNVEAFRKNKKMHSMSSFKINLLNQILFFATTVEIAMGNTPRRLTTIAMNYGCSGGWAEFKQPTQEWETANERMTAALAVEWEVLVSVVEEMVGTSPILRKSLEALIGNVNIHHANFKEAFLSGAVDMVADKDKRIIRINPMVCGKLATDVVNGTKQLADLKVLVSTTYNDLWLLEHFDGVGVVLFDIACIVATFADLEAFAEMYHQSPFIKDGQMKTADDGAKEMVKAMNLQACESAIVVILEAESQYTNQIIQGGPTLEFEETSTLDPFNHVVILGLGKVELVGRTSTGLRRMLGERTRHMSWSTRVSGCTFKMAGACVGMVVGVHWKADPNLENYERDITAMLRWGRIHHNISFFYLMGDLNIASAVDLNQLAEWLSVYGIRTYPSSACGAMITTRKTRSIYQAQVEKANKQVIKPSIVEFRWGMQSDVGDGLVLTGDDVSATTPNTSWMFDHGAIKNESEFVGY